MFASVGGNHRSDSTPIEHHDDRPVFIPDVHDRRRGLRLAVRRVTSAALSVALVVAACSDDDTPNSSLSTSSLSTSSAPPVTAEPLGDPTNVEIATINVLHGLAPPISGCAEYTDQCNIAARVQILWSYLETDVGCPEIIALQEIALRWFEVVPLRLPDLCDGNHVLLTEDLGLLDQEMILTTLPVLAEGRVELAGAPVWSAHWAQLEAADGLVVDVFSTHYASDSFNPPCSPDVAATTCHRDCATNSSLGDCHPFETLAFFEEQAAPGSLRLVIGDLNDPPDGTRIRTLLDAGFTDTYLAAGNPECPEEGGLGCTSGIGNGADTDYDGLDVAETVLRSRIDHVLARPPAGCELLVDGSDTDGDGTFTGHWANTPLDRPFEGLYWGADHVGIQADVGIDCA